MGKENTEVIKLNEENEGDIQWENNTDTMHELIYKYIWKWIKWESEWMGEHTERWINTMQDK